MPSVTWVLLLTVACLAPFLNRPFFVDDTLFVKTAQQIQQHPFDFYGFNIRWFHAESPMIENTYNPPLASYYLAAAATIGGWSEPALHVAFMLPALAAAWGMFALSKRFCGRPLLAAAAAILTPVFVISGTTLMCDIMLLAFWVWALVCFETGLAQNNPTAFIVSGVLAGLAFWTKFFGFCLIPLMLAYGLWRTRKAGWWLLGPILPLLFVAGYEAITWRLYGHGHFLHAAIYSHEENVRRNVLDKLAIGLCFSGGCFLPLLFYLPLDLMNRWGRRGRRHYPDGDAEDGVPTSCFPIWLFGALALVLIVAFLYLLPRLAAFQPFLHVGGGLNWVLASQAALFCATGIWLLSLAFIDWWHRRDSVAVLLGLWVLGVFVFVTLFNWTVNGRSLLPMAPALAILVARRMEEVASKQTVEAAKSGRHSYAWLYLLPLIAAAGVSIGLALADTNVARAERDVTCSLFKKYERPGRAVWFEGHGGFQFYLEKLGARPLDMAHPEIGPEDVVIIPNCAPGVATPNLSVVGVADTVKYLPNQFYSTSEPSLGASFYEAVRGPLPFAAGRAKPDYCFVFARRRNSQ